MTQITRRGVLAGAVGVGSLALLGSQWPRLNGTDIPGRHDDSLSIAILGTNQDAEARQSLVKAFNTHHPDIPVRLQAIQGADWADFFAKILTMVAAGTPPDVCVVATEGAQLFAERLAEPLDEYLARDVGQVQDYFNDVHPSLIEAFMYKGSLYQMPIDFNAANIYNNAEAMNRACIEYPRDDWSHDDFLGVARQMKQANASDFVPFYWTNRLWGGIVPWLYINDTSFLTEQKSPGGEWLWDRFYPGHVGTVSGGFLWDRSNATDPKVAESFEFVRALVQEGLGTSPVLRWFHRHDPRWRVLGTGACRGRPETRRLRRRLFPEVAQPTPPVRRGRIRHPQDLETQGRGLGMGEVLHLPGGDAAGLSRTHHHPDAPLDVQRSLLFREGPEALEGVLRHPGEIPMCPDPGPTAAGRRRDRPHQERPRGRHRLRRRAPRRTRAPRRGPDPRPGGVTCSAQC